MKIALLQTDILLEQLPQNRMNAEVLLQKAAAQGVRLAILPEMSLTGFSMHTQTTAPLAAETVQWAKQMAMQWNLYLGFGWTKGNASGTMAENHYSIAAPDGTLVLDYIKIHPFSYAGEDRFFTKGDQLAVCEIDGVKIGCAICYDLRFPEVFSALSQQAEVLLVPANWPERRRLHWCSLLTARAIETQSYVVGVNCVGEQAGLPYSGDSRCVAPDGEILLDCGSGADAFVCEISAAFVHEVRRGFPVKADRQPALYQKWNEMEMQ